MKNNTKAPDCPDGGKLTCLELLDRHGFIVIQGSGTSMYPFILNSTDRMYIRRNRSAPRRLDVAVFCNADGKTVAHRVLRAGGDGFVTVCGDNQTKPEIISERAVFGTVLGVFRGSRFIDFTAPAHRFLAGAWSCSLFIRRLALAVLHRVSRRFRAECEYTRRTAG